jgi:hypothetical protein
MRKIRTNTKRGALELSIGTIVILVIAMSMLVLGIILVNKILGGATDSVDTLNDKVKGEINSLFSEEGTKIGIKLGANKLAKIEQGTNDFGIAVGAKTKNSESIKDSDGIHLYYKLKFKDEGCKGKDFHTFIAGHKDFHDSDNEGSTTSFHEFDDLSGDTGNSILFFDIPDGVGECTQKLEISTYSDMTDNTFIESASFRVQIISSGIFS